MRRLCVVRAAGGAGGGVRSMPCGLRPAGGGRFVDGDRTDAERPRGVCRTGGVHGTRKAAAAEGAGLRCSA